MQTRFTMQTAGENIMGLNDMQPTVTYKVQTSHAYPEQYANMFHIANSLRKQAEYKQ
jgi:hypothetical protein